MSEKFENREVSEQDLQQVSGGAIDDDNVRTFSYRCMTCGATKYIQVKASDPFPTEGPICCGAPTAFEGVC